MKYLPAFLLPDQQTQSNLVNPFTFLHLVKL